MVCIVTDFEPVCLIFCYIFWQCEIYLKCVSWEICGQRRPRSDCASAQSDKGLHYRIIGYYRMFQWRANAHMNESLLMRRMNLNLHLTHVQSHLFAGCHSLNI